MALRIFSKALSLSLFFFLQGCQKGPRPFFFLRRPGNPCGLAVQCRAEQESLCGLDRHRTPTGLQPGRRGSGGEKREETDLGGGTEKRERERGRGEATPPSPPGLVRRRRRRRRRGSTSVRAGRGQTRKAAFLVRKKQKKIGFFFLPRVCFPYISWRLLLLLLLMIREEEEEEEDPPAHALGGGENHD